MAVKDLCRRHGFSEPSYYPWRSKVGGDVAPFSVRFSLEGKARCAAQVSASNLGVRECLIFCV